MIQRQRLCHFAINLQRPGIGFHAPGVGGRIGLIEPKLIEVVIAGDFIFRRQRQFILPLRRFREVKRCARGGFRAVVALKPVEQIGVGRRGERQGSGADAKHFQDLATL